MDGGLRFRGFRFLAALGLSTLGVCSRVGMLPGDLERYLLQVQGLLGLRVQGISTKHSGAEKAQLQQLSSHGNPKPRAIPNPKSK